MTAAVRTAPRLGRRERIASATNDSLLIGWRNLKRIPRIPELAIFAILIALRSQRVRSPNGTCGKASR